MFVCVIRMFTILFVVLVSTWLREFMIEHHKISAQSNPLAYSSLKQPWMLGYAWLLMIKYRTNICWWFQPLWKIWVRQLGWLFPIYVYIYYIYIYIYICGEIIQMFQTINQMGTDKPSLLMLGMIKSRPQRCKDDVTPWVERPRNSQSWSFLALINAAPHPALSAFSSLSFSSTGSSGSSASSGSSGLGISTRLHSPVLRKSPG